MAFCRGRGLQAHSRSCDPLAALSHVLPGGGQGSAPCRLKSSMGSGVQLPVHTATARRGVAESATHVLGMGAQASMALRPDAMLCSLRSSRLPGGQGSAPTLRSTASRCGLGMQTLCRSARDRLLLTAVWAAERDHIVESRWRGGVRLWAHSGLQPAAVGMRCRAGAPHGLAIHQHCQLTAMARIQGSIISNAAQKARLDRMHRYRATLYARYLI